MAGKEVFDGKRHVWFGGWLAGPMSIPRVVYEGTNGLLYMKPAREVVNVFSKEALSVSNLSLAEGATWNREVPQDYFLVTTVDMSGAKDLVFIVREGNAENACHIVISAKNKSLMTGKEGSWEYRPLPIDFDRPVKLEAFILGSVAEVFVNSQYAATFFLNLAGRQLRLESNGGVIIRSLMVKIPIIGTNIKQ